MACSARQSFRRHQSGVPYTNRRHHDAPATVKQNQRHQRLSCHEAVVQHPTTPIGLATLFVSDFYRLAVPKSSGSSHFRIPTLLG